MSSTDEVEKKHKPVVSVGEEDEKETLSQKVHSANKWEKVNLGDDGRKKKFLKLMGADKKEHRGRFVIGEEKVNPHDRDKPESEIEEKLEDQFKQGIEHKLLAGPKAHIGLGFHEDPKKISDTKDSESGDTVSGGADSTGDSEKGEKETKTEEKPGEKHKLNENSDSKEIPVKKKMMYNFVKASDS